MSQDIIREVIFVSHFFLMGIIITFVYDSLRILRRLVKHNIFWISLEDLFFWMVCAVSAFGMLYRENNGTLRWFAVAGAFLGMLIYKKTVSAWIVKAVAGMISQILHMIWCMLVFICRPIVFWVKKGKACCGKVKQTGSKIGKYIKNRLTAYGKTIKIMLCKR